MHRDGARGAKSSVRSRHAQSTEKLVRLVRRAMKQLGSTQGGALEARMGFAWMRPRGYSHAESVENT
jgi:uncharacterized protein YjlB